MRILLKSSSEGERATVDHDSGSRVGISTGVWNPDHLVGSSIAPGVAPTKVCWLLPAIISFAYSFDGFVKNK